MGGSSSQFTQEELKEYQELTYFTKKEILHVFKRFYLLDPPSVRANKNARLPKEKIWSLPELKAPKNVKVEYAFKVYDFDSDGYLDKSDLKQVVDRLTGDQKLSDTEMEQLVDNLFEEADLDEDDQLSFAEFEHVISKAPDFINSFRIRL